MKKQLKKIAFILTITFLVCGVTSNVWARDDERSMRDDGRRDRHSDSRRSDRRDEGRDERSNNNGKSRYDRSDSEDFQIYSLVSKSFVVIDSAIFESIEEKAEEEAPEEVEEAAEEAEEEIDLTADNFELIAELSVNNHHHGSEDDDEETAEKPFLNEHLAYTKATYLNVILAAGSEELQKENEVKFKTENDVEDSRIVNVRFAARNDWVGASYYIVTVEFTDLSLNFFGGKQTMYLEDSKTQDVIAEQVYYPGYFITHYEEMLTLISDPIKIEKEPGTSKNASKTIKLKLASENLEGTLGKTGKINIYRVLY
jgi:hypothetical protein